MHTRFSETSPSTCSSRSITEATAGNDLSSFFSHNFNDSLEEELQCKDWVQVLGLENDTTNTRLKKMFYPYGADEAFVCMENARIVGFVGFELPDMAAIAIEKMNGFIPCLQSHVLSVFSVPRERVMAARLKLFETYTYPLNLPAKLSFADDSIASLVGSIQTKCQHQGVYAVVDEIMSDLKCATSSVRERILTSLQQLPTDWPKVVEFRSILLRQLLHCILTSHDLVAMQASNSGAIVGGLFKTGHLPGDPFVLAARLLKSGVTNIAQVDGIFAIAHACHRSPLCLTEISFGAQVRQMVANVGSHMPLGRALLGHLCHLEHMGQTEMNLIHPLVPLTNRVDSIGSSPLAYHLYKIPEQILSSKFKEQRRKTLYLSSLSPTMPQSMLMSMLLRAGPVNKVRICAGKRSDALFAFAEMSTNEGEFLALKYLNTINVMGNWIHVQQARNPIQDKHDDDAIYKDSLMIRPCLFGRSSAPIFAYAGIQPKKH